MVEGNNEKVPESGLFCVKREVDGVVVTDAVIYIVEKYAGEEEGVSRPGT